MSNRVVNDPKFPVGTSVSIYPRTSFKPGATPVGSPGTGIAAIETQTVASDNKATFTTLVDGTAYVAYAQVSGQDRYVEFIKGSLFVEAVKWAQKVINRRAAIGTS